MSTDPTRRALLIGGLATAVGGTVWLWRGRREAALQRAVLALADEVELTAVAPELGRVYLDQHRDEADAERLSELLFADGGSEVGELRAQLAERIAHEWEALDTVQVDGWIVARSEARFLALTTLLSERVSSEG